mmetsp:Transcript_20602/g.58581  ORF Transcript_20602/g.58581 Transcript_20602/m.58581 type:complete len:80 (-) Transcript_20602:1532-1771(-)
MLCYCLLLTSQQQQQQRFFHPIMMAYFASYHVLYVYEPSTRRGTAVLARPSTQGSCMQWMTSAKASSAVSSGPSKITSS